MKHYTKDSAKYVPGMKLYRKTTATPMVKIDGPFTVDTSEGTSLECLDGWLALDAVGSPYPVSDEVHRETYEFFAAGDASIAMQWQKP